MNANDKLIQKSREQRKMLLESLISSKEQDIRFGYKVNEAKRKIKQYKQELKEENKL